MIFTKRLTLDEVLDRFFYAYEQPDAEKLKAVLAAYPEYRNDIVEFTALWASYVGSEPYHEAPLLSDTPAESLARIQSFVMGCLHENAKISGLNTQEMDGSKKSINGLAGLALRKVRVGESFFRSTILLAKIFFKNVFCILKRTFNSVTKSSHFRLKELPISIGQSNASIAQSHKSANKLFNLQTEPSVILNLRIHAHKKLGKELAQ